MAAQKEKIINNYITAYNNFDIAGMTRNLAEDIRFVNMANGVADMTLHNLTDFKNQAIQACAFFSKRTQTITAWAFEGNTVTVNISYHAVLAKDLANGLKQGAELQLQGKSVFTFSGNEIVAITDIS